MNPLSQCSPLIIPLFSILSLAFLSVAHATDTRAAIIPRSPSIPSSSSSSFFAVHPRAPFLFLSSFASLSLSFFLSLCLRTSLRSSLRDDVLRPRRRRADCSFIHPFDGRSFIHSFNTFVPRGDTGLLSQRYVLWEPL